MKKGKNILKIEEEEEQKCKKKIKNQKNRTPSLT